MSSFTFTEVVRLAQVGTSGRGRGLLTALAALPGADVVVLCEEDESALSAASRAFPDARATTRSETVAADAAVDAVVISDGNADVARDCLEAGKHVLIGPSTSAPDVVRQLVELAAARDVRLMTGHALRYHPAVRAAEALAATGELGAVRTVTWHLGDYDGPSDASVLDAHAPSALSVVLALVGSAPRAVSAHTQGAEGGADVALVVVQFEDGALADLRLSRIEARTVRRLTVTGSRGLAFFDGLDLREPLRIYTNPDADEAHAHPGSDLHVPRLSGEDPVTLQCREFVASIRERRTPRTDGADGLAVAALLDAARASVQADGRRVELA